MADIQYLNYDNDQIEQLALMTSMANNIKPYILKLPWSTAKKERVLNAYRDIINRGIKGASSSTGEWLVEVGGDLLNTNSMERQDREAYELAANFIQKQMATIPVKKKEEEKKEDKSELPLFDNEYFTTTFRNHLSNNEFGGNKVIDVQKDWNTLDERGENGIRGRKVRAGILANNLKSYADSLDESKLNFEGSPFKNLADFKTRINNAVNALVNTPDNINDDNETFRKLGLRASDWFDDGSNDTFVADDGKEYTYGDYYNKVLPTQQKAESEAKRKAAYNGTLFFNPVTKSNMSGRDPILLKTKYENDQALLTALLNYAQSDIRTLTPDEVSEVHGAYKYLAKDPIDNKLLKQLLSLPSGLYKGSTPNRFKKIKGIDNLIWDNLNKRVIQINTRAQQQAAYNQPTDLFKGVLTLKELSVANMNTPISLMTEWSPEMKKEMEAIAWDITSILDPEAFSGSAMALYASHLRDEANPNRSTFEKWFDRGTAALGGILGVGDLLVTGKLGYRLYQLGKSMGSVSKFAGMLGAGFGAIGAYEARDSIMKLSNPSSLTPLDIENISYGFMGLIGLKSFAKVRNKLTIGKQANPTVAEHNITVNDKNGTHIIKVDEATAKEINNSYKFGRSNKTKSDAKTFNHEKVKKAVEEYNKNPENTKKIDLESASIQSSSKFGITTEKPVKTKYVRDSNAPEYAPIGTRWYNPFGYMAQGNNKWGYYLGGGWQRKAWENVVPEQSSKGLWLRAKEFWNPEPKPILLESVKTSETKPTETPKVVETPKTTETSEKSITELRKSVKSYLEGTAKHSGNILSEEPFKAGDFNFEVNKFPNSSAGNIDISFNGKVMKSISFDNLKDMMKKVADFLKNNRRLKDTSGKIKRVNIKEMGEILRLLKAKGVFKRGGTIDKLKIQRYKEFIKK